MTHRGRPGTRHLQNIPGGKKRKTLTNLISTMAHFPRNNCRSIANRRWSVPSVWSGAKYPFTRSYTPWMDPRRHITLLMAPTTDSPQTRSPLIDGQKTIFVTQMDKWRTIHSSSVVKFNNLASADLVISVDIRVWPTIHATLCKICGT